MAPGFSVLLNDGRGGFEAAQSFTTGNVPTGLTSTDFNGDGKLDLAVANNGASSVSILLGQGDGTFAPKADYPTPGGPYGIADRGGQRKSQVHRRGPSGAGGARS